MNAVLCYVGRFALRPGYAVMAAAIAALRLVGYVHGLLPAAVVVVRKFAVVVSRAG